MAGIATLVADMGIALICLIVNGLTGKHFTGKDLHMPCVLVLFTELLHGKGFPASSSGGAYQHFHAIYGCYRAETC